MKNYCKISPLKSLSVLFITGILFISFGCEAVQHVVTSVMPASPAPGPVTGAMHYPSSAQIGQSLDIEVVHIDRRHIRLENRTTSTLTDVQLFLNHEYGASLPTIPIGRGNHIPLSAFTNQYSEKYPTGTFLAPEKAKDLILAEVYANGKLHKLTVRLKEDWRLR